MTAKARLPHTIHRYGATERPPPDAADSSPTGVSTLPPSVGGRRGPHVAPRAHAVIIGQSARGGGAGRGAEQVAIAEPGAIAYHFPGAARATRLGTGERPYSGRAVGVTRRRDLPE